MKPSDIDQIVGAGLITPAQRDAIIAHFKLDRQIDKLMVILSMIGAVLVTSGIVLVISANWNSIPHFAKLAGGILLMLGCHWAGSRLRKDDRHPVIGQALHLIGSGLFLGNIALLGQVYNLSSRPPNAILLWFVGIAPLPWILRSRAQLILTLCAFGLWIGMEIGERDSMIYFDGEARQFLFFAMLGVALAGLGMKISAGRNPEFGSTIEKFGLLVLHIASYPVTLGFLYGQNPVAPGGWLVSGIVTAAAILLVWSASRTAALLHDRQWRITWALALCGVISLSWMGLIFQMERNWDRGGVHFGPHWIGVPALFILCLLQIQVGLLRRSPWLINLAMTFLALHIVTAYFQLFGTMGTTGLMFIVTGLFLITMAFVLEKRRRALIRRMNSTPPSIQPA